MRAVQFIRAFPRRRLAEGDADVIADYQVRIVQKSALSSWRFCQTIDAIQTLYSIVNPEWAAPPDRDFWRDSARTLETRHTLHALNRGGLTVRSPLDAG
jgi:hypothetical protein